MTLCDVQGVPAVVQRITYQYSTMMWEVDLFNGTTHHFTAEHISPQIGLMDRPKEIDYISAYWAATKLVLEKPEVYLRTALDAFKGKRAN